MGFVTIRGIGVGLVICTFLFSAGAASAESSATLVWADHVRIR
jgi:hypothetical protein